MPFPDSFLRELTDRCDITDVVSGYVNLSKRSGSNIFGLCPFHSEKTPSFSVSPDKQIFYCFGCGKGGGVINFIMEIENLSYPDAVHFLARRAGLQVPEDRPDETRLLRERILTLNREAALFFHEQLIAPSGQAAREYIKSRSISPHMAKIFGLGFAPDSWDSLLSAMRRKNYGQEELERAGLSRRRRSGSGGYDTFRNRLIFPVIDVRGSVIGFSGRILGEGEPKYLNSPETPVFNKGHNLFALNLAKKSKNGYIILAEGNIDVIALHQAGFDSAVASLGTSLTPEQARLISRYTDQVIIAYDSDNAGKAAAQRAIGIFEKLDIKVRVLQFNGAKDPDDFIKKNGADAFRRLIESSENHVEFRLSAISSKYSLGSDEGKVGFLKEAAEFLAGLPGTVEREVYSMRVAEMTGVSQGAIEAEVARQRKKKRARAKNDSEREALRPERLAQPILKGLRFENIRSAAAEEGVIRLLYLDPSLFSEPVKIGEEDFSAPELGHIFSVLLKKSADGDDISIPSLGGSLTPDETSLLTGILQKPESLSNGKKALEDYIDIITAEKNQSDAGPDLRAIAEKYREKKGYGGQI